MTLDYFNQWKRISWIHFCRLKTFRGQTDAALSELNIALDSNHFLRTQHGKWTTTNDNKWDYWMTLRLHWPDQHRSNHHHHRLIIIKSVLTRVSTHLSSVIIISRIFPVIKLLLFIERKIKTEKKNFAFLIHNLECFRLQWSEARLEVKFKEK